MDLRRVLYSNIVLSGGSTLFKGDVRYLAVNYGFSVQDIYVHVYGNI